MIALTSFSNRPLKSTLPPPQQPGKLATSHKQTASGDSVHFSGSDNEQIEKAQATQEVDTLLNRCDEQPVPERMNLRNFLIETRLNPAKFLPTASSYFLDAFDYYDQKTGAQSLPVYGETLPHFSIMDAPWARHLNDPPRVYGHEPTLNRVLQIVRSFKQQSNPDRAIAFFGPHGSGKSVIPKTIMQGLEHYSQQPEGALWTYAFVFPNGEKATPQSPAESVDWCKAISQQKPLQEPEQVAAQLMANLNLNPIFLLPPKERIAFIQSLQRQKKLAPDFNVDYYLKAQLEGYGQKVLNELHRLYEQDPKRFHRILEHVQVERWQMSNQEFRGLVEVPASPNPDAILRESFSPNNAHLPSSIQRLGKRTLDGLMPRAHRGIFYMDDFGRNGQSADHLLMPLETGEVTLQERQGGPGITREQLDFVPMLSVNPEVLEKARKNGKFDALEQRMLFVPVPWERRYKVEKQILEPIIRRAKERGKDIAPHTLDAFSLWITMTRLFPVQENAERYVAIGKENKDFSTALKKLTPLKKALLYQGETVPGLTHEEQQALKDQLKVIATEHTQSLGETEFSLYEGGIGVSNRSAANLLKQMTARPGQESLSFIDVFETIAQYVQNTPQYEQKRNELLKERGKTLQFPGGLALLKELEDYARDEFMVQLKATLGMHQEPSVYVNRIQQYSAHIEALQEGRSVPPQFQIDGAPMPDNDLIQRFENIALDTRKLREEERKSYRNHFMARATAWKSSDSEAENVNNLYKDEMHQLRKKDEQLNQQYLAEFRNHVKILLRNPKALESQKETATVKRLDAAVKKLQDQGYSPETLPRILDWALEKRYIADQGIKH